MTVPAKIPASVFFLDIRNQFLHTAISSMNTKDSARVTAVVRRGIRNASQTGGIIQRTPFTTVRYPCPR